jgi:hypothetical protein
MGPEPGVAGNRAPAEDEGVYICDSWDEVEYFAEMAQSVGIDSLDVWEFFLSPTETITEDGTGYRFLPHPVPPERLRRVRGRWSPPSQIDEPPSGPEYLDWISVMENKPDISPGPPEWPRWYVHGSNGFEELEPAVEWATNEYDSVIVGPLTRDYYLAGRRPKEWNHDEIPLRPWPPSDEERQAIEQNSGLVRRRLENIEAFAPGLAGEVAEQLESVLPEPWTSVARGGAVTLLYEGQDSHQVDFMDWDPDEGLLDLLDFAQDWISELTTVPWPPDPSGRMQMLPPTAEVRDGLLQARYGAAEDPVLELVPIDLSALLP